jgi:hypothetical protein
MNGELIAMNNQEVATQNHSTEVESQRAIQEVQAAYVIAKKFPRDENKCLVRIIESCKRPRMAENAIYSYPKGGTRVTGPSIRLAEVIAKNWGNLDYGVKELSRSEKSSVVLAYCIDLETNMRKSIEFTAPHIVDTKSGGKAARDNRDIYEIIMNMASRRVRNCILATIPEDIVEEAKEACMKTMAKADGGLSMPDRIKKMLIEFSTSYNVTPAMIEKRLGHKTEAIQPNELVDLRGVFKSIKDGFAPVTAYFDLPSDEVKAAKIVVIFSAKNEDQVKEVTDTMKKLNIASDMQQSIIDNLEGKDIDLEFKRLCGEALK